MVRTRAKPPKECLTHHQKKKDGTSLHQLPWGRELETIKNRVFQFQFYLFFKLYHFMCINVLPQCTSVHHTCTRYPWCQKKAADPLGRQLQVVVNCHVSAGNKVQFRVLELRVKSGADWSTLVTAHCLWGSGQSSQLYSHQWSQIPQGNCVSSSQTETGLWLGTLYWPSPCLSQPCCYSWEHQPGQSHIPFWWHGKMVGKGLILPL